MTTGSLLMSMMEGYYASLIYRLMFNIEFAKGEKEILAEGMEYFLEKMRKILAGLEKETIIVLPKNNLSYNDGEPLVLYTILVSICSHLPSEIIDYYQINPDQKNVKGKIKEREVFLKDLIWTAGHCMKLYDELICDERISNKATQYNCETSSIN